MTGSTIRQFDTKFRVILGTFPVTFQTKPHIDCLRVLGNIDFTHIPVTILAIDPSCDMWAVVEMYKIRHDGHRHPLERLVILYSLYQGFQLLTGLRDLQLLVTAPTLGLTGQASRWSTPGTGVTVQALDSKGNMSLVREFDGLLGCSLSQADTPNGQTEKDQSNDH